MDHQRSSATPPLLVAAMLSSQSSNKITRRAKTSAKTDDPINFSGNMKQIVEEIFLLQWWRMLQETPIRIQKRTIDFMGICFSLSNQDSPTSLTALSRRSDQQFFSERELMFMFAICRPSVCRLSSVCLSVCRLSVSFVHPTQPIEIFGNVSAPFNTLVTWRHTGKILRRSFQGNPSVRGLNQRG